jgi:hypothetical protein
LSYRGIYWIALWTYRSYRGIYWIALWTYRSYRGIYWIALWTYRSYRGMFDAHCPLKGQCQCSAFLLIFQKIAHRSVATVHMDRLFMYAVIYLV